MNVFRNLTYGFMHQKIRWVILVKLMVRIC